jgi:hypothetical protein
MEVNLSEEFSESVGGWMDEFDKNLPLGTVQEYFKI